MAEHLSKIVRFYRLKDWIFHLGLVVLGFVFAQKRVSLDYDLVRGFFISFFYLAYGYSFNKLCDVPVKIGGRRKYVISFLPMALSLLLLFVYYVNFVIFFLVAIFLNTAYSLPERRWKDIPVLSIAINVYLFDILFLFGTYLGNKSIGLNSLLMTGYMAGYIVFVQLLHEMDHAFEDNRSMHFIRYEKVYLIGLVSTIFFILFFAVFLYFFLHLGALFLFFTLFLWGIYIFYFLKVWNAPISLFGKAAILRKAFRCVGVLLGMVYFFCFLT